MAESQQDEQFVQRLEYVLQFLSDNGFDKAATAVYEQLERKAEPDAAAGLGGVDDVEPSQSAAEYGAEDSGQVQEYRSASSDHVLGSVGLSHTEAEDAEDSQSHCRWPPGAAEALQTRLSGSSRLYEDPDVDEYSSMDDTGYIRRSITNQQDFVVSELDFLRTNEDECYFHEGSLQHGGDSCLHHSDSCSNSSSASLSSPGMSTSAPHAEGSSAQQQQQDEAQGEAGNRQGKPKATGDAAWDSGPAGITFAEPVTTPTKDSQRSSISDLKPSLSRVESLSNSFIEDLESVDGAAGGAADGTSRHDSEAGSIAGDLGRPPRRSRADGSDPSDALSPAADVIDLSPPSPPPDCAADAGFDLSNIFELGLRASSRTSSIDVLQGSVRCWSEADSDLFGQQQQLDTGRGWASQSAGNSACGSAASSRAGSSLGLASLAGPGGLIIKPRQSAGASRLQSSSHHDPEQESATVDLQQQQQQQAVQQQQQAVQQQQQQATQQPEQPVAAAQPEQPTATTSQQPEPQQQQGQQQPQVQPPQQQEQEPVLILSPTSDPQQGKAAAAAASQQQQQQQQRHQGGSDSGSSSSAAGPVTPSGPSTSVSTQPQAAAADSSAAAAAAAAATEPVVEASTESVAAISPAAAEPAAAAVSPSAAAAAAAADSPAAADTGCSSSSPASPPAAAAGGFGFTFPTTPPSAVDAAVHEERAERVFSTWASNHSRSLSDALDMECAAAAAAAGGEDAEADTSSSRPPPDSPAADGSATAATADSEGPWVFPALDLAAAAAAGEPPISDATAAAIARSSSRRSDDVGQITVVVPVSTSGESLFLAGAALAASCSKNSSPAGQALSRGGSRAHSSSSAAARVAAAGDSSRSSSRRLSAAGRQQAAAAAAATATSSSGGGVRSPLGDGVQASPGSGGVLSSRLLQQQASAGYDALGNALIPALDADAESTGGFSGSGELSAPRYVVDEAGNLLYEYDTAYIENRYEMFDLRVIHRRRRTGFEDSKEFPIRKNDLIAGRYQVMDFLGSAAFSQAVQALDVATGALVCLKIIKNNKDYFDQSLDEIKLLRYVNNSDPEDEHHIVRLYDFFYYKEHLILVCELLRANLYEFQKYQRENGDDPYFTLPRIQRIAIQVLQSLAFLHSLGLVHSDLKPENILIKSYSRCEVKVIDLGSSCFITDHLSSYVQSRSYRAPEVILGLPYGQKIDIWSLGCILAELATGYVLFQNDSLGTLLARLEGILGPLPGWMVAQGRYSNRYYTRSRQLYERSKGSGRYELLLPKQTSLRHRVPSADEGFLDFLSYLLTPDPTARPGATEALQHPWLSYPFPPVEQIPD